jgi:hypothetical protein
MVGSLGDVVFEVSSEKVKTFQDLKFQHAMKYAQHDIHGGVGLLELTGRAPSTASLKITLDSALGVDPLKELAMLFGMMILGKVVDLILDGAPRSMLPGSHWIIENISESLKVVNNEGKTIAIEVDLQLKEYVDTQESAAWDAQLRNTRKQSTQRMAGGVG